MAAETWAQIIEKFLNAQPERGLIHYKDVTAALAETQPERFSPRKRHETPHLSVWRLLNESSRLTKVGDGWFQYHPWGEAEGRRLRLSREGGRALVDASNRVRVAHNDEQTDVQERPNFSDSLPQSISETSSPKGDSTELPIPRDNIADSDLSLDAIQNPGGTSRLREGSPASENTASDPQAVEESSRLNKVSEEVTSVPEAATVALPTFIVAARWSPAENQRYPVAWLSPDN